MISIQETVLLCVLAFLIGRAVQNWSNRTGELVNIAYRAGYEDGRSGREPLA